MAPDYTPRGNGEIKLDWFERTTQIGLLVLASLAALGGALRIFGLGNQDRLDQTTLFYFLGAGSILLLKQIKTLSFGQIKLEMIKEIAARQDRQEK
ncbi:hypothetical protein, partial [Rhodoplanes sp. SY1]|uniref:hypothetical protein n=1 Tax=Rhodoplanes sp. SY1 TaxID=3166646 RepID=UPI0038B6A5F5